MEEVWQSPHSLPEEKVRLIDAQGDRAEISLRGQAQAREFLRNNTFTLRRPSCRGTVRGKFLEFDNVHKERICRIEETTAAVSRLSAADSPKWWDSRRSFSHRRRFREWRVRCRLSEEATVRLGVIAGVGRRVENDRRNGFPAPVRPPPPTAHRRWETPSQGRSSSPPPLCCPSL